MIKSKKRFKYFVLALLGLFVSIVPISGCSKAKTPEPPAVTISFEKYHYDVYLEKSIKVEPIIKPDSSYIEKLIWYSDNPATAEVNEHGEVTGKSLGNTMIHAYDESNRDIQGSYNINVLRIPNMINVRVSLDDDPFDEMIVSSMKHLVKINHNGTYGNQAKDFILTTEDSSLVDIVQEKDYYYLIAKQEGDATIHIVSKAKPEDTCDWIVHIKKPYLRDITLSNESIYLINGDPEYGSYDLGTTLVALGEPNTSITFSSSNPEIVDVDAHGHITANKAGKAKIIAKAGDISKYCEVLVSDDTSYKPAEGAIKLGDSEDEFFKITAQLEKYSYDHFITGIPILTNKNDEYSSCYKLNLNTCNQLEWERYFGVNGSFCKTAKEDYWAVEPAMSNLNFLNGLRYGIDRVRLAEVNDKLPKVDVFSNAIINEDKTGITPDTSYRDSTYHKQVIDELIDGTDGYGYSFDKAKQFFIDASNELISQGVYKQGDTIEIEICWHNKDQLNTMHPYIKEDLEKAFNTSDNPLILKVIPYYGEEWSDSFYKKGMRGQYDVVYGDISGSTLKWQYFYPPAMSISDYNRNPWCLNFGMDTNDVRGDIVYNNKIYSFESLVTAVNVGAFIKRGAYCETPVIHDEKRVGLFYNNNNQLVLDIYFYIKYSEEITYSLERATLDAGSPSEHTTIKATEINKIGDLSQGWQHYQIVFSKDEILSLNNKCYQEIFDNKGINFYFSFSSTYFSNTYAYGGSDYILLNDLISDFSSLF